MACKTCDHTMQAVNSGAPTVWWCPRCGSIKTQGATPSHVEPKIVHRTFLLCEAALDGNQMAMEEYERNARECVLPPTAR